MSNNSNDSYIKFWGVRGSFPTPEKDKIKYGGETSCIEIRTKENDCIILDMGTGIRNLGKEIMKDDSYPKEINILLSHYHWDHIVGFFAFAPLYYKEYTINNMERKRRWASKDSGFSGRMSDTAAEPKPGILCATAV